MTQVDFDYRTDTVDVVSNWPYDYQYIAPDESGTYDISGDVVINNTLDVESGNPTLWDYLSIFASELRTLDKNIDELYEQRFIESATGKELEKLGAPLGIVRRAGESDESLRFRVSVGKVIAASDGTASDIEGILSLAFGEENLESIGVQNVDAEPVVRFLVPQPYIDDIPLSQTEFQQELERAFPCGHSVQVVTSNTFLLGESGQQGIGEGELI